jgi:hypothetical protein
MIRIEQVVSPMTSRNREFVLTQIKLSLNTVSHFVVEVDREEMDC